MASTTTINSKGGIIKLISKEIINEFVEYYNIITNKNLNLYSNDILTSCRYNNIYPIVDMKFVKNNRVLRCREEFSNISDKYYYGLRLNEQIFNINDIEFYVNRMKEMEINFKLSK